MQPSSFAEKHLCSLKSFDTNAQSQLLHLRCTQSLYKKVLLWEIFMEQELRFGLDLGRFGNFWGRFFQGLFYEVKIIWALFTCSKNALPKIHQIQP